MSATTKDEDREYEDRAIDGVERQEGGWLLRQEGGLCFWVGDEHGVEPRTGQMARFYGKGFGYPVRGLDLDGREVFWRSEDDLRLQHEIDNRESDIARIRAYQREGRAKQDAQYAALPDVFRRRIDGFRARRADFRWRSEAYELSCCVDAVKIAAWAGTPERVKAYHDLTWEQQKAAIPDLFEGHSGNSFAFAVRLAYLYLTDPALVEQEHGALCILTGCKEYGCPQAGGDGAVT